jgi:amidase
MSEPLWKYSAVDLAAGVASREFSCAEVVSAAVARMRDANPAVNAVTRDLGDEALETAGAMDAALAAGADPGPLTGVPITIKDNTDVQGQSTPNGLPALNEILAPDDSPVVKNLKDAGAIIVGRTNTPEFSFRVFTDNPLFGATRNAWDSEKNPGGSSGGAAASVALGIGAIAHGNDIGGSLRYPAFCNGVSAIRPTLGRVPAFLPSATAERPLMAQLLSVQGPIAREVRDVRLALTVMSKGSASDPWWTPAPIRGPEPKKPIRVALSTVSSSGRAVHPAVLASLESAADILRDAGYEVVARDVPNPQRIAELWTNLMITEVATLQQAVMKQVGSEDINFFWEQVVASGEMLDLEGFMRGQAERSTHLRDWSLFLEETPIILAPQALDPVFPLGFDIKDAASAKIITDTLGYSVAINLLGLPSALAPTGLHEGLPLGVQLIGARFREDMCLDAAEAIENRVGVLTKQLWD